MKLYVENILAGYFAAALLHYLWIDPDAFFLSDISSLHPLWIHKQRDFINGTKSGFKRTAMISSDLPPTRSGEEGSNCRQRLHSQQLSSRSFVSCCYDSSIFNGLNNQKRNIWSNVQRWKPSFREKKCIHRVLFVFGRAEMVSKIRGERLRSAMLHNLESI